MIIKEKRPKSIWMNRNDDGTYEVLYQGVTLIDANNNIQTAEVSIPRCAIEWDDKGVLPQARIAEIFEHQEDSPSIKIYATE